MADGYHAGIIVILLLFHLLPIHVVMIETFFALLLCILQQFHTHQKNFTEWHELQHLLLTSHME